MMSGKFIICFLTLVGCHYIKCGYHIDNYQTPRCGNLHSNNRLNSFVEDPYNGPTTFEGTPLYILPTQEWVEWYKKRCKNIRYLVKYARMIIHQHNEREPSINIFYEKINMLFPNPNIRVSLNLIIPFFKVLINHHNKKDIYKYATPIVDKLVSAASNHYSKQ